MLVVDTNILLSSLTDFSALAESGRWTVVVPLPVMMELDSQANGNATPLGQADEVVLRYITASIRSHSASLKVQTSRGNYLASLSVRTEQVDFAPGSASWERNMDDLILRAAIGKTSRGSITLSCSSQMGTRATPPYTNGWH